MGESLKISTSIASLVPNVSMISDKPAMANKTTITRKEVESKPQPSPSLFIQPKMIYFFGTEILNNSESAPLTAEKVSDKPAKPGIVRRIINYFERHFGSLSEKETQQIRLIKSSLAEVNDLLERDQIALKDTALAKQNRKGQAVNSESLLETEEAQIIFRTNFRLLQTKLNKLKELKTQAETLAEKHSNCSALPNEIQALEKKVEILNTRLNVTNELQKLEEVMVKYSKNESWDNFVAIRQQKLKFEDTLRLAIRIRPELQRDKYIKACLKQPAPLSAATLARMIERAYPQLSSHLEHVFDHLVTIQKERISQLEQKAARMNTLFTGYSKIANEINTIEQHLYTPSWYDSFLDRQAQLKKKQGELEAVFKSIQEEDTFNADEAAWVHALANKHSQYKLISHNIYEMSKAFAHSENREDVSCEMNELIILLKSYKNNLEDAEELSKNQLQKAARQNRRSKTQPRSQRMSSVNRQNSISDTLDSSRRRLVKNIAESLKPAITTIYEESRQVVHQLPEGFEGLSSIEQLKTLTVLAFPKLENRISHLIHLMQAIADLQTEEQQTLTQQVEEIILNIQHPAAIEIKAETKAAPPQLDPLQQDFIEAEEPSVIVKTPITTRNAPTVTATETIPPKPEEKQQKAEATAEVFTPVVTPSSASIPQASEPVATPTKNSSVAIKEEPQVTEPPKTATVPPPPPPPPPAPKVKTSTKVTQATGSLTDQLKTVELQAAQQNAPKQDANALLMQAIRGGVQLRKVGAPVQLTPQEKAKQRLEEGNDLASALARQVLARRNAVTGGIAD